MNEGTGPARRDRQRLVRAGLALLVATSLAGVAARGDQPDYAWSTVAVSQPPVIMHPGLKTTIAVVLRNDGAQTWFADAPGNANPTRLAAVSPLGRASLFASEDPTWLWSGGTRIRMESQVVPPGGLGVFAFTFTAPVQPTYPRTFTERFAPVVEGVAVLDQASIALTTTVQPASGLVPPIPNQPIPSPPPNPCDPDPQACVPSPPPTPSPFPTFGSDWNWSRVAVTPVPAAMHPGLKVPVVVVLRNEGDRTWESDEVSGGAPVRLAAVSPRDRASVFGSDDPTWMWSGGKRIRMLTPVVHPGNLAVFSFTFTAPAMPPYPRDFVERFAPVAEGVAWMDARTIDFTVQVRPASALVPALPNPSIPSPEPLPTVEPLPTPEPLPTIEPLPTPSPLPTEVPLPETPCEVAHPSTDHRDPLPPAVTTGYLGFGQPIVGPSLSSPSAVAVDPFGKLNVADTAGDRVVRLDPGGATLLAWGGSGSTPGRFSSPSGIAVSPSGLIYVADTGNDRIQVFSLGGTLVKVFGSTGSGLGQFRSPKGLAVIGSGPFAGALLVADSGNDRVQVVTGIGEALASFGSTGNGPGQMLAPAGVSYYGDRIYVADTGNDRVQRFLLDGSLSATWGGTGEGRGCMRSPQGVLANEFGVFVSDTGNDRVHRFARWGPLLETFGSTGGNANQMRAPKGLASSAGTLWVAESGNNRLQRFAPVSSAAPPVPCGSDPLGCFGGAPIRIPCFTEGRRSC